MGPPFCFPLRRATAINQRTRVNQQIRISPVRVIDPEGEQVGILPIERALEIAEELGLDLVEVAPMARPPVCRIMDYGKFKYEEQRKAREARKKQHQVQLKEVKMRPGIEDHDFEFKIRHARRFLEEGNKVKLTMMFRGRQMAHPEIGREVLDRVVQEVADIAKVEASPNMEGRSMTMVLAPTK
jgi:translation initiation factor IF-3